MNDKELVKQMRKGLVQWYDFKSGGKVLFDDIDNNMYGCDEGNTYDYVVCNGAIEQSESVTERLRYYKKILKSEGILLFMMNNRMGIRYFCGDKNPYTRDVMDRTRLYSKAEMDKILCEIGYNTIKYYSVLSNLENPSHVIAYDYIPNEDLSNRLFPTYYSPQTVFLEEESLYDDLFENDLFHPMANAYLIETSPFEDADLSNVLQVTITMDRQPSDAMFTIVYADNTVTKMNAYPEGQERFVRMLSYADDLRAHGISVVDMKLTEHGIKMPYINAPTAQASLKKALKYNKEEFLSMIDKMRDQILNSSEVIREDDLFGPIVRYGYLDLIPLNSFYVDGNYVFFDQEFRVENYPVNAIIARVISTFFFGNEYLNEYIDMDELFKRYELFDHKEVWFHMEWEFLSSLRNELILKKYHESIRRNNSLVRRNRKRMNYSADLYLRTFQKILESTGKKDIFIFGSGRLAALFLDLYGSVLPIKGVIDNNKKRVGYTLRSISIISFDILKDLDKDLFMIIICIKDYLPVLSQLRVMHVCKYGVFDGINYFDNNCMENNEFEEKN